jgi:hypothetical protein
MSSVGYTAVALIQVTGVIAYQYTGIAWFMLLPAAQAALSIFLFVFATAYLLSLSGKEEFESEKEHLGIRFVGQLATLITAYQLYLIGYQFFSGIIFLTATCLILMIIYIKIQED